VRSSIVSGAVGLVLLGAGCSATAASAQGARGPATTAGLREYGGHAYRLGAEQRDYTAELIVRQVPGGIAVLAAGYSLASSQGLWSPALKITFYSQGDPLYRWALPIRQHYTSDYASGYRPVCVSTSGATPRKLVREYVDAGCAHPVFPVDIAADTSLSAENANTGERHVVTSAGIILFPESGASSEQ
jgi:hypothetical protein